ncbi:MAG: DUF3822 family protein [Prevotellaceae bacterium]|jgi:hypothetical protein|nr:DUF3822 family protein [Prevotellaceae bacterium]
MQLNCDFVDKSFSLTKNRNYRLSIQISLNGFSFCIYDVDRQKHVVFKDYGYSTDISDYDSWSQETEAITELVPVSRIPAKCLFVSRKNVLIPANIFDEKNLKNYLSFSFNVDSLEEIQYKYIPEIEGYCSFSIPSNIISPIKNRFTDVQFFNTSYQVIRRMRKTDYETYMEIVFCENYMDVTIFKEKKLIFNNSFEIFDLKDVIYFTSVVINRFDISQIPIYTSGKISNAEIMELTKYFPEIIQHQNKRITLLLGIETSSKFYNLLSLYECE